MTIRDRIFARISELEITQKEFALRTGIPETTVSDWKKKKTNPTAEKILVICKVLDVTPEWLLSGVETHGTRSMLRRSLENRQEKTQSGIVSTMLALCFYMIVYTCDTKHSLLDIIKWDDIIILPNE